MGFLPFPVMLVFDVVSAVLLVLAYLDAAVTSVPGLQHLEYMASTYSSVIVVAAFFGVIGTVGVQMHAVKFVAMYKMAKIIQVLTGIAVLVGIAVLHNEVCEEARAVQWRWDTFTAADSCDHILLMICLPVVVCTVLSVLFAFEIHNKFIELKEDELYRTPIVFNEEGERAERKASTIAAPHASLSPRTRANLGIYDEEIPIAIPDEAVQTRGKHNPTTGFYFSV